MPILEHRECTVEPGCTYDVYVETADRRIQNTLRYTVPGLLYFVCYFHFPSDIQSCDTMRKNVLCTEYSSLCNTSPCPSHILDATRRMSDRKPFACIVIHNNKRAGCRQFAVPMCRFSHAYSLELLLMSIRFTFWPQVMIKNLIAKYVQCSFIMNLLLL